MHTPIMAEMLSILKEKKCFPFEKDCLKCFCYTRCVLHLFVISTHEIQTLPVLLLQTDTCHIKSFNCSHFEIVLVMQYNCCTAAY